MSELNNGNEIGTNPRHSEIPESKMNEFVDVPIGITDQKEFARVLYSNIVARFWSGEFDTMSPNELRQKIKRTVSPEAYEEFVKIVTGDKQQ